MDVESDDDLLGSPRQGGELVQEDLQGERSVATEFLLFVGRDVELTFVLALLQRELNPSVALLEAPADKRLIRNVEVVPRSAHVLDEKLEIVLAVLLGYVGFKPENIPADASDEAFLALPVVQELAEDEVVQLRLLPIPESLVLFDLVLDRLALGVD